MGWIVGLQNEHRFRKIEFARNRLHLRRFQPLRVEHDSQWIAGQDPLGKDVIDLITPAHRHSPLVRSL